jgi:hypothetical protein
MKLELTVDRIEDERVVLIDQDQNVFVWPKNVLGEGTHEGQLLIVELKDPGHKEAKESKASAKDILNEVLNLD